MQRSEEKNKAASRAESFSRLLERRYGPLPPAVQARIMEASLDELIGWMDQLLDPPPSLEPIFGDAARPPEGES